MPETEKNSAVLYVRLLLNVMSTEEIQMERNRAFLSLPVYLDIGVIVISGDVLNSRCPFPPHAIS